MARPAAHGGGLNALPLYTAPSPIRHEQSSHLTCPARSRGKLPFSGGLACTEAPPNGFIDTRGVYVPCRLCLCVGLPVPWCVIGYYDFGTDTTDGSYGVAKRHDMQACRVAWSTHPIRPLADWMMMMMMMEISDGGICECEPLPAAYPSALPCPIQTGTAGMILSSQARRWVHVGLVPGLRRPAFQVRACKSIHPSR